MSNKLELEFVQQQPFAWSRVSLYGLGIFAVSIFIASVVWQQYQTRQRVMDELSTRLNQFSRQSHEKKLPAVVNESISPEKKLQIQATVSALTVPWGALMQQVEMADMKDVTLLSFEPSSKKKQILLTGEAKNLQSILGYVQKLEAQPMLEKVYLQKHNIDLADVSKPVKFTIYAGWNMADEN
jgi:hypothetical protein